MKVLIDAIDDREGNYDTARDCERCRYLYRDAPGPEYSCLLTNQITYDYDDIHHEYLSLCPFETVRIRLDFFGTFRLNLIEQYSISYEDILNYLKQDKHPYVTKLVYNNDDDSDEIFVRRAEEKSEKYYVDVIIDKYELPKLKELYKKYNTIGINYGDKNNIVCIPCHFYFLNEEGEVIHESETETK